MATVPSHFGSGKFGAAKFSQGAAVTSSSAYGIGPYGVGRYGVGTGTNYQVAGQTGIGFSAAVKPTVIYAVGGATGITLLPQASAARIWSPAGATQISLSAKWLRPYIVHDATMATQISFRVQGELVKTWQDTGPCFVPCEGGAWTQEYPPWTVRQAA